MPFVAPVPRHPSPPSSFPRHRSKRPAVLAAFLGLAMPVWPAAFAGEGVFLLGNDALQLGRASSGVASPRSAYWCYMNPASMVDLGKRIDVNWYSIFTNIELSPNGAIGNPFDGDLKSDGIYNIFSGGAIVPLETGVLGFGMYVPSGTGVTYPHSRNVVSRLFQGNKDRELNYQHMRLVLSYAHEFDNGWAMGVGLHGSLSRFETDHITLALHCAEADKEWDAALGAGFGLGIYKSWDRWSFGAAYTSRHWTQSMDKYEDLLASPLDTPQVLQVGVACKVTQKLELTADFKYLNWKGIPIYADPMAEGGFNWEDQYGGKIGLEYRVNNRWTLMAGFSHMVKPIDEDHVFLSGLVPVIVEDHATAGFTYRINEHHEVHVVGIHGFDETITDSGQGDLFSLLGRGTEIRADGESLVVGYTYKF